MGTIQVSIYDMQLQTKYKLLSELTDFIQKYFHTISLFALEIRHTVCSYGTSTAYFVTYVTICGAMNYVHRKASVLGYFSYLLICVFVLALNFIKNIPNVDFYGDSHEIGDMSRT